MSHTTHGWVTRISKTRDFKNDSFVGLIWFLWLIRESWFVGLIWRICTQRRNDTCHFKNEGFQKRLIRIISSLSTNESNEFFVYNFVVFEIARFWNGMNMTSYSFVLEHECVDWVFLEYKWVFFEYDSYFKDDSLIFLSRILRRQSRDVFKDDCVVFCVLSFVFEDNWWVVLEYGMYSKTTHWVFRDDSLICLSRILRRQSRDVSKDDCVRFWVRLVS